MNDTPEKMDLRSMDISADNRAKLKQLFPAVFTETRNDTGDLVESIDFEKLKAELGTFTDLFEKRRERYGMDWPGKKDAMRLIQQPSVGTLKPCREESVDFDNTEHLFIEGDNLEVLKLLQKAYYGKVKAICIDPPYNTGKEFIYPDNYSETLDTYLSYAGLADDAGRRFSTNTPNEGRFHTKWLNMMYPRLYLARNLLRDDGVIFIHIDDHEVSNLRRMCDEIFGEENLVACLTVINNMKGRNDKANVATCHEYLLIYSKGNFESLGIPLTADQLKEYKFKDKNGEKYALRDLRKRGRPDRREDRPKMFFPIFYNLKYGYCSLERKNLDDIEILPKRGDGTDGRWRWGRDKVNNNLNFLHPRFSAKKNRWDIDHRVYLKLGIMSELGEEEVDDDDQEFLRTSKTKSFWWGGDISTDVANREFKKLFNDINPDYPKSPYLIERILHMSCVPNDIIIDFFSGYATTAHALLDLNKQDNGNRKFIMVQLPEPCDEASEAFKAGYKTIADIGKERIRRVIKKLSADDADKAQIKKQNDKQTTLFDSVNLRESAQSADKKSAVNLDLGFKVFKLDKSNFKLWDGADTNISDEKLARQLELHIDHINPKASPEDVLYELLLKAGFKPTEKVVKKQLVGRALGELPSEGELPYEKGVLASGVLPYAPTGKTVFSVAGGGLLICLEDEITRELIDAVAEAEPIQFICLDRAFHGNDQLKANAVQTFEARNQGRDKAQQIVFRTV